MIFIFWGSLYLKHECEPECPWSLVQRRENILGCCLSMTLFFYPPISEDSAGPGRRQLTSATPAQRDSEPSTGAPYVDIDKGMQERAHGASLAPVAGGGVSAEQRTVWHPVRGVTDN